MSLVGATRRGEGGADPVDAAPHRRNRRLRGLLPHRRRMSLRSRLLLGLVVVAAVGFGVAGSLIYAQIRSYLLAQLEVQVQQGAESVGHSPGLGACGVRFTTLPVGSYIFVYDLSTLQQVCAKPVVESASSPTPPLGDQPAVSSSLLRQVATSGDAAWTSASSPSGVGYELYLAPPNAGGFGFGSASLVVAAEPLSGVEGTVHHLLLIDVAVYAAVLALLAALGYAVVRVGLRPLEEIEATAGAIAAGDLSRRVERDEPETEVGRLGASLNSMLSRIERAFSEQQSSERRLRQFIADASHELRTPLTSIRGYAELFRRGAAARPEDLERSMRRIEEEARRMGVLVEDMLLLARLDQGRPLERTAVDLSRIAADASADAAAVQPERPISFESSGPVLVAGDEARLRQVAANLVQNALVHTPPLTPVTVSVLREGALAVLEVADAGPGIPPEHAERIFERFYRADSSRARNSGGTGLGLAIVASLAAAHGGRASVQTAPGLGTRFRVELPAIEDAASTAATAPSGAVAIAATGATAPSGAIAVGPAGEPAANGGGAGVGGGFPEDWDAPAPQPELPGGPAQRVR